MDEYGSPQVRIIDVILVEDDKLIFCTARGKNFHKELMATKKVAILALCKDFSTIRINGQVEKLASQKEWIDKIFESNPVMNNVYPGDARYILEAFCVCDGEIEHFELRKRPIERNTYIIGSVKETARGFEVTDACIECGKCANICPQKAIENGKPAYIHGENCLHCGYCFENCHAQAIIRK